MSSEPNTMVDNTGEDQSGSVVGKKQTMRCFVCNKRVGLLGFECKCNPNVRFCNQHRYFYEHGCTVNAHENYKELLRKQNVVVKASKLETVI